MKIVIPGGTGHVGAVLAKGLTERGHEVVVLSRRTRSPEGGVRFVPWDGRTIGAWAHEIDGADAVINLAGRSVNCRYTDANLRQMMDSRVTSTRAVGAAIGQAKRPPKVWLQMSTATIYADSRGPAHDENGEMGGNESHVPLYWEYSVRIARNWEAAQAEADVRTRRVALRTSLVMSPDRGSIFDYLSWLARLGVGGAVAGGGQYVSWIHADDFVRAVVFLLDNDDVHGPVNLAAPSPLPQRDFARALRRAWGRRIAIPATRRMAALGAFALRSDTELLLKSRKVVPGRLSDLGFAFTYPEWTAAASDLVARTRASRGRSPRTSTRR